jgi:hypothetical protein
VNMMTRAAPAVMSAAATTLRDMEEVGDVEFASTRQGEQRVFSMRTNGDMAPPPEEMRLQKD